MFRQLFSPLTMTTLFVAALLVGCTAARMELPANMPASASEMPVEGRKAFKFNEPFSFGSYDIFDVQYGWKVTTAWGMFGFDSSQARQTFEFRMRSKDQEMIANCATGVNRQSIQSSNFLNTGGTMNFELHSSQVFAGGKILPIKKKIWILVMNQDTQSIVMDGILTNKSLGISVEGTQKLSGTSMPLLDPTGYYFRKAGKLIGSVEVINNGAVWIDSHQSKTVQTALAGASGALLLYQDLK